jgi:hypothetical protein
VYWIYRTKVSQWRNQYIQAKLVDPDPKTLCDLYGDAGFQNPRQHEPYGVDLSLTFQVNSKHPHPDNYFQGAGFELYSKRLVELMQAFNVKSEIFPATLVDSKGIVQSDLEYYVFHPLEGIIDAMDAEQSGWTGDRKSGVSQLVLDEARFEHRPIFLCKYIHLNLMRDDVKQEIQQQGITGFSFLAPERFRSGKYGFPPEYDD